MSGRSVKAASSMEMISPNAEEQYILDLSDRVCELENRLGWLAALVEVLYVELEATKLQKQKKGQPDGGYP